LCRTGDLARYRATGEIEFLGRVDHQVKIRGFRIELGEIEAVVAQHPRVKSVAAVACEEAGGGKRIVACVVAEPGHPLTVEELRNFLKEKLPQYMVPSRFVFLEALPLM